MPRRRLRALADAGAAGVTTRGATTVAATRRCVPVLRRYDHASHQLAAPRIRADHGGDALRRIRTSAAIQRHRASNAADISVKQKRIEMFR